MRALGLLLLLELLLLMPSATSAAGAQAATDQADRTQAILDRLAKLGPSEQQAWLRRLEERAARAARLTLKPDEAAAQQAKTRGQLHQKLITWQVLREVIQQTDAREKGAIDMLLRRYQDLVFETFHRQIDVYGQWQQAWLDVNGDWRRAGSPFDVQDRLVDWLEAAIRNATPATLGPIPKRPELGRQQPPSEPTPKQPEEPKTEGAKPQAAPKTQPGEKPKPEEKPKSEEKPERDKKSKSKRVLQAQQKPPQEKVPAAPLPEPGDAPPSLPETPAGPVTTAAAALPPRTVEIQVDELAARIAGCNLAFRALEAELDEKGDWTAARLEPLVDRLTILAVRRNDLNLFREAVPKEKRAAIGQLASAASAVSQVAAHVVAARSLVSGAKFKGTDSDRQTELKRLDELSRRLAELAGK